jgi:hypothetical protein
VISPPRVQLYTAPFCAYCDRARALLERRRIAFEEIDLSRDLERCCELEALTGKSVAQLAVAGLLRVGESRMGSGSKRGSVTQPASPDTHREASREETQAAFGRAHPRYADTAALDELRRTDFACLDAGGHVYLDYTGAGLYADSQLNEHLDLLRANVFGNPHSLNPTSAAMAELVEQARTAVLDFFQASPEDYVAIFTPNATGALRLVGEAYPFRPGDRFPLTFDNHNSVNGIRVFARAAAPRQPTCRASHPTCASTSSCCPAT